MRRLDAPRRLGDRIALLTTAISGVVVLIVAAVLSVQDYRDTVSDALENLRTQAAIVAMNSDAPIAFGDRSAAQEALAALAGARHVQGARLLRPDGSVFAAWREQALPPVAARAIGTRRVGDRLEHVEPVVHADGTRAGLLEVHADASPLGARLLRNLVLAVGVALLAMALAYAIARRIQRTLVAPLNALSDTARRVSETRDYGLRAPRMGDDELAEFADLFNEMLGRIQQQQLDLAASQAEREALLRREREAREQAEHASRLKDEFVATLSHELRTPMTPIIGWVQILQRTGALDDRARQGIEVIERNARVQMQLIEDLLDMSRIVSGKLRIEPVPMAFAQAVDAAIGTVRSAADARGIAIVADLDPALRVRGDAARLQQVAWNLLSNAIKFTPARGRVDVRLLRQDESALLEVRDSGEGIAPDFLPFVFDRFRQADSSTTRRHGGLGLGLSIVRQLVELHGGSVAAHSEGPGQGARFSVRLPLLHAREDDAGSDPVTTSRARLEGARVLVVDDDADACELLRRMLEAVGARVATVGSAEEALACLDAEPADVLLSDVGMPETDGYALIRALRGSAGARATIPAIALTAFARPEDRAAALEAGFQVHLGKPVDADALIAAVAALRPVPGRV